MAPGVGFRRCAVGDLPESAGLLSGHGVPITRMRYEDFAHQPRHTIELALTAIGLPPLPRYGRRPLERSSPRVSDE